MKKFGDDFFERVKILIDKDQYSKKMLHQNLEQDEKLFEEVLTHATFCNEIAAKFQFREDLVEKVCSCFIISHTYR
jgi:hypothetical protein